MTASKIIPCQCDAKANLITHNFISANLQANSSINLTADC